MKIHFVNLQQQLEQPIMSWQCLLLTKKKIFIADKIEKWKHYLSSAKTYDKQITIYSNYYQFCIAVNKKWELSELLFVICMHIPRNRERTCEDKTTNLEINIIHHKYCSDKINELYSLSSHVQFIHSNQIIAIV